MFPLAAVRCGIEPVWASEIEKAPISITKRHFPDMAHLGDVTKLDGRDLPPVHIITFGSPCQNLSQIGNRKGLAGEKSSLFFQAVRIIREMREATNGLSRNRNTGGTGLGLYIVRKIMEMHHAKYGITNTSNGVMFWFELPCKQPIDNSI